MTNFLKNPYLNSIYAEAYILIIVSIMQYFGKQNMPDNFLDPVIALSVFVLSAAVMGYLFLGEPLQLYLSGEKKQAVSFFMKTIVTFAGITIVVILLAASLFR